MSTALTRTRRRSRFLLDWTADYCLGRPTQALEALTAQVGTLTRASIGTAIDAAGLAIRSVHSQPRFQWVDVDGDGIRETAGLLLEAGQTNLVLQSENFGTTWTTIGTPTRTAAAQRLGTLVLDLLGDNDGAALEGYSQVVAFTGNAIKGISLFLAAGSSTSTVIRLRDTTAAADRLLATITWTAGVPAVVMSVGTFFMELLANGVYRFRLLTTTVTAANSNALEVYPASTAGLATANVGTVYAGGVQVTN